MKKHMRSTFLNPKYNPSDRDSVSNSALGGVSAPQVQNAKSNSTAHPFRAHNSHTDTDTNNDSNRKSKSKSCGDSMIMYKWSEHLLKDLIEEIAKRLSLKDRVRMGAVCRSWSSAASNCSKQLTRTRNSSQALESVPKILIPWVIESHSSPYSTRVMCSMYNPSENKIYNNLNRFALFPAPVGPKDDDAPISKHVVNYRGIRCLGSVEDWLIISDCVWHKTCRTTNLESAKVRLYLFHPMTGDHVMLPSPGSTPTPTASSHPGQPKNKSCPGSTPTPTASSHPGQPKNKSFLRQMVTCSVPKNTSNNACIVAAIAADRRMLLFCRPTDEKWTCQLNNKRICEIQFHDDGKLYALEMEDIRHVVVFDPQEVLADSDQSTEFKGKILDVTVPDLIPYEMHSSTASLFSSSKGDIMLFWRDEPYTFIVLKLKFDDANGSPEWVKMNGSHYLEDEVIFVSGEGGNTSVPRSKLDNCSPNSKEFLGLGGGNCIYFPSEVDVRKICVYNVAQGTLVKYPPTRRGPGALKPHRISVWFTPKPVVKDYTSTDPASVVEEYHPTSTDDYDDDDDEDATICFSNNFMLLQSVHPD